MDSTLPKQYVPSVVTRAPKGSGRTTLIKSILVSSYDPTQADVLESFGAEWKAMEGVRVRLRACYGWPGLEWRADTDYEVVLAALPIDASDEDYNELKQWLEHRSPVLHKNLPVGDWGTPATIICVLMQIDKRKKVSNDISAKFKALATQHTFPYYETSALTGEGIFDVQNAILTAVNFPPLLKPKSSKCVIM